MASSTYFRGANSGFQAGIVNGPVHAEFHPPPERPESPPNPLSNVPFRRDVHFVRRESLLDRIDEHCTVPGSWTALVGIGGVGKSKLAIEYAYQVRDRSPQTWVLWVHASNAARFKESYQNIADRLKLSGRENPKVNVFKLVHDWLQDSRGPWLLILDNVDDARFLFEAEPRSDDQSNSDTAPRQLRHYLPQSQSGSFLVTTRTREAALRFVEQHDAITVEPMDREEAITLLKTKVEAREDGADETIAQLAARLDFMPLAIIQAAAYISQRMSRCSMKQYLDDFEKGDRERLRLLNHEAGQLYRDAEAKNSIVITWQISFDHISDIRPSAADLLSLMSLFDRQGIPEHLLRNRTEHTSTYPRRKDQEIDEDVEFEKDVVVLREFSFISDDTSGNSFEMHRLVQLATRNWLQDHDKLERWKEQFNRNLCEELPTGGSKNWPRCQALFPHVKAAAAQRPKHPSALSDWATIMYRAGDYATKIGNWIEGEEMLTLSMKVRTELLGHEDPETLESKATLGIVHMIRGRLGAAEKLLIQVTETRKKKLGADHPDTLASSKDLSFLYNYYSHRMRRKEFPYSKSNLARIYRDQGRLDAAEELASQVLESSKNILKADHPDTLFSMYSLAFIWYRQGRINDAVGLMRETVSSATRVLGVDHPNMLSSLTTLKEWEAL